MINEKKISALADKNRVQWELVKKVQYLTKDYSQETLLSFSINKLAGIVGKYNK